MEWTKVKVMKNVSSWGILNGFLHRYFQTGQATEHCCSNQKTNTKASWIQKIWFVLAIYHLFEVGSQCPLISQSSIQRLLVSSNWSSAHCLALMCIQMFLCTLNFCITILICSLKLLTDIICKNLST